MMRASVHETVSMGISGHRTRATFDRYNTVDESDSGRRSRPQPTRKSISTPRPKTDARVAPEGRKVKPVARRGSALVLFGVALGSALCSAASFLHLRGASANARLRPVEELNASLRSHEIKLRPAGTAGGQRAFLELLHENGFRHGSVDSIEAVIRLQVWVGNQVQVVALYSGPARGYELLEYSRNGGGQVCAGMADIMREALLLLGIPARAVQLTTSSLRPPAHTLVEAFVEDRWRVFDPTVNVTFESEGRVLGVAEIQERLWTIGPNSVMPVFHGPRRYPASLERDARGWRQYFANALVTEVGEPTDRLRNIPPWRYWTGPSIYYFGHELAPFPSLQDWLYFSASVVLPVASILAALLGVALLPASAKRTRPKASPSEA
jgi:hypothetical protein